MVAGQTDELHHVVVGGLTTLEKTLSRRLRADRSRNDVGLSVLEREAGLAHISLPTHGVSGREGRLNKARQLSDRHIQERIACTVIGHFKYERFAERMVRETGQPHILVGFAHTLSELQRCILHPQHINVLRFSPDFVIHQCIALFNKGRQRRICTCNAHQFAHQHIIVHRFLITVSIVRHCPILRQCVLRHQWHTPQRNVSLPAGKIISPCFLSQNTPREIVDGKIHRVS